MKRSGVYGINRTFENADNQTPGLELHDTDIGVEDHM